MLNPWKITVSELLTPISRKDVLYYIQSTMHVRPCRRGINGSRKMSDSNKRAWR